MKEKLLLGVSRRNITPPIGCCLAGYAPDVIAKAVNDDLTVTTFVFEQDGKRALLASFPAIEEDEAPYRLLCTEYPAAKD